MGRTHGRPKKRRFARLGKGLDESRCWKMGKRVILVDPSGSSGSTSWGEVPFSNDHEEAGEGGKRGRDV